jgi:hypothetical protein
MAVFGYNEFCEADITVMKGDPIQYRDKIAQSIPHYYGKPSEYELSASNQFTHANVEMSTFIFDEKHPDSKKMFNRLRFVVTPSDDGRHQEIFGREEICTQQDNSKLEKCDFKKYKKTGIISIKSENKMNSLLEDIEKQLSSSSHKAS